MDRFRFNNQIEHFGDISAGTKAEGMPNWTERKLEKEYVEPISSGPGVDKPFLLITLLLLAIGLIMVLSASFVSATYMTGEPLRLFRDQSIFALSGVLLMVGISRFSVRFMSRWIMLLLVVSIGLLVAVELFGTRVNGATRWLALGGADGFRFQPSEIVKVAVILAFAQMAVRFGKARMKTIKYGVLPFVAITALIVILLERQPHMSAVIIIGLTAVIMMFAGGTRLRYFLIPAAALALVLAVLFVPGLLPGSGGGEGAEGAEGTAASSIDFSSMGHWGRRIENWLDPDADPLGGGFQTRQSLNAVGSGGVLGQGLGQSRQKYMYLPEEHNDFIFAVIAEELGFVGAMLILSLFALLIIRGYWLAMHAKDRFSSLIVIGITSLLAIQVFFNVAVVTGLIPATGIPLPLFSYGGTALWVQLAQMGIVLAISREIPVAVPKERGGQERKA
ncbi:MAG: putative lipid II flippase FtsW [Oscillospiraceae bacterium]|nr:putative lipid II flippase FtsW [Oscillospiraceae bacterium]